MKFLKLFGHLILIIFLTALTQIGGVIWILSLFISIALKGKKRFIFPVLYLVFNLLIIPPVAKQFGREQLPIFSENIKPRNWVYPLLFRNYVNPELKELLESSVEKLKHHPIQVIYLDANFPFYNGFPLLPHLSHNDGKKIDITFLYLNEKKQPTHKKPSISGYGAYVKKESYYSNKCEVLEYWQYDFPKYLTFGTINNLKLDKKNTTLLIKALLSDSKTQKIFIEPYLKDELGLGNYSKIRFHGCKAVRHDDHIHLQIN
nr:hypothetical protein [uncultured Psychroserpens sp.]